MSPSGVKNSVSGALYGISIGRSTSAGRRTPTYVPVLITFTVLTPLLLAVRSHSLFHEHTTKPSSNRLLPKLLPGESPGEQQKQQRLLSLLEIQRSLKKLRESTAFAVLEQQQNTVLDDDPENRSPITPLHRRFRQEDQGHYIAIDAHHRSPMSSAEAVIPRYPRSLADRRRSGEARDNDSRNSFLSNFLQHRKRRKGCPHHNHREQLLCPTRNSHHYDVCITREQLCDHVIDCPDGKDEDPKHCFFFKPLDDQLKTVSHAVVLLIDLINENKEGKKGEL